MGKNGCLFQKCRFQLRVIQALREILVLEAVLVFVRVFPLAAQDNQHSDPMGKMKLYSHLMCPKNPLLGRRDVEILFHLPLPQSRCAAFGQKPGGGYTENVGGKISVRMNAPKLDSVAAFFEIFLL